MARYRKLYEWDERLGVSYVGKNGHRYQAIQLLHGPATLQFRRKCGNIIVAALNDKRGISKEC